MGYRERNETKSTESGCRPEVLAGHHQIARGSRRLRKDDRKVREVKKSSGSGTSIRLARARGRSWLVRATPGL